MKILSSLLLILLLVSHCFGQKQGQVLVDSLIKQIPVTKNDSLKVRLVKRIADEYFFIDTEQALKYSKLGLKLAHAVSWQRAIGAFNASVARAYSDKGILDSCMFYNEKALSIHTKSDDKVNMASTLNNMGTAEQNLAANYPKATKYYLEALKISEILNDKYLIALAYDNLSHIYFAQSDYNKALNYAFKSLRVRRQQADTPINNVSREVGNELANIASIYTEMNDVKKAKSYYQQALPLLEKSGNLEGLAKSYSNLSILSGKDYNTKFDYGLKAEKLWNKVNPMHLEAANNLGNLGIAYLDLARSDSTKTQSLNRNELHKRAFIYLKKAIEIGEKHGKNSSLAYFKGGLAELQALNGDYKNAYENFRAYQLVQDSLYSQENKNRIAGLEGKRELELRDKQIEINKLELKTQRKQQIGLIIGLAMLAVIGGLLYWQNRTRRRTNTTLLQLNSELDEANKVKAKFFAILSHDLRSPVSNLINFLHLQKDEPDLLTPELAQFHERRITESAEDLLENMESMLLWSKGQMQNFQPQIRNIAVEDLFDYIRKFFSGTENVKFTFENPDSVQVATDEDYLKTIMQNLTANAIKALKNTENGHIQWEAEHQNGQIILSVTDNGPGASGRQLSALYNDDETIGIKTGFGLHLIRDLAKAISCKISFESKPDQGTAFQLMFATERNVQNGPEQG